MLLPNREAASTRPPYARSYDTSLSEGSVSWALSLMRGYGTGRMELGLAVEGLNVYTRRCETARERARDVRVATEGSPKILGTARHDSRASMVRREWLCGPRLRG